MTYEYVVMLNGLFFFFFNDTATTEIYTLSLHDALPICMAWPYSNASWFTGVPYVYPQHAAAGLHSTAGDLARLRSEEHTSELQSRQYLVCRLLLEKKKKHSSILFLYYFSARRLSLSPLC